MNEMISKFYIYLILIKNSIPFFIILILFIKSNKSNVLLTLLMTHLNRFKSNKNLANIQSKFYQIKISK